MLMKIPMSATSFTLAFPWFLFAATAFSPGLCHGSFNAGCIESEREALLQFKLGLKDPSNRLSSWDRDADCCEWPGVICDNLTSRVLELHLRSLSEDEYYAINASGDYDEYWERSTFRGKISQSLLNLKHLKYLDLSNNNFEGIHIPKFLGSMKSLRYLNFSGAGFGGMIPHQLGNLSNLQYLNLEGGEIYVENLDWLSSLSSLEFLDLSSVNLSKALDWLDAMNKLPSLVELHLSYCSLNHKVPSNINFSSLAILDLTGNSFGESSVPSWIFHTPTLTSLDLSSNNFFGPIPVQLQNITSLRELDLSDNSFNSSMAFWLHGLPQLELLRLSSNFELLDGIPSAIGNFTSLNSLDLTYCNFQGAIPSAIGNLTSLNSLDLSHNELQGAIPSAFGNLTSLNSLDLSENKLEGAIPSAIGNLTSLNSLDLSDNKLEGAIPSAIGNLTSLNSLDLSNNKLEGAIPSATGNLTSLNNLDLSFNGFEGGIPASFKNLCKLRSLHLSGTNLSQEINEVFEILSGCVSNGIEVLSLSNCQLSGHLNNLLGQFKNLDSLDLSDNSIAHQIPATLGVLTSLTSLRLSNNKLNGSLPIGFGALENLVDVDISYNSLEGEVSEIHFANLTNLRYFDASHNQLILRVNPHWIPPFQLVEKISLRSWDVGPQLPRWLRSLKELVFLDLSNSKISSTLPVWFSDWSLRLSNLNLSHNQLHGKIPYLFTAEYSFSSIDLSSNKFNGPLPNVSSYWIDLSDNLLSGSLFTFLCHRTHYLITMLLNLGKNHLSGEIPDCWMNWEYLEVLKLNDNYFSGKIPSSIGILSDLQFLNLRNNTLFGEIPLSLEHCEALTVLELDENRLEGNISTWLENQNYSQMVILNLRGNQFHGHVPIGLCRMTYLQILDLANNNLSGTIPTCINNFSAMVDESYVDTGEQGQIVFYLHGLDFSDSSSIMTKGEMIEYSTNLNFVRSMDLSNNKLSGDIPEEITRLEALHSLNLSHNLLSGSIPGEIGNMKALESLDFSQNQLFGEIPPSMSSLTFLSRLNLSNNKLSGIIPSGTQLQGFDPSTFSGNKLCGLPLSKNCNVDGDMPPIGIERGEEDKGSKSFAWFYFYVSIAPGYVVGFWAVMGPLVFNRRWRHLYFNFLDNLWDKFMVWYYVNVARFVKGHGL
ncbi:receptor-like protein EIX2 [Hevea brasiliensis]|uniref:receptor-like protein EIX2 n=1 Tax=Hevea brasiliensis TaxID=3981 RepID=UPI0025E891ED|nr:receptor-like protein EIX2 [Hevea brasiliensis]